MKKVLNGNRKTSCEWGEGVTVHLESGQYTAYIKTLSMNDQNFSNPAHYLFLWEWTLCNLLLIKLSRKQMVLVCSS